MTDEVNKNDAIKNNTHVVITVAFKEQSGSIQRYTAQTTVVKLGLNVENEGKVAVPDAKELAEALDYDTAHPQVDPKQTRWFGLAAKYKATNNDDQRSVGLRIREAVVGFLKSGGLDGHPIDQSKYVFDGGPSSLSLTPLHDDDRGSVTGHANEMYLSMQASATWGK